MTVLPALLVVALGVLLDRALRRWFEPVPLRAWSVLTVVLLVLFGRALLFGGVLAPLNVLWGSPPLDDLPHVEPSGFSLQVDPTTDFIPYFTETRRALARGEWPLWNPYVGAGEPLLSNPQAQHFHPFQVLTYALPLERALGVVAALKVLVAFVFTFLVARRLGLGEAASLSASLAYVLGGFFSYFLQWPQTQSAAMLPVLLYAVERNVALGSARDRLLLAGASSALVLGGHPETMMLTFGLAGLVFLERWLGRRRKTGGAGCVRAAVGTGVAVAVGIGVTAPVLLPTMLAIPLSERHAIVEVVNQELRRGAAGERLLAEEPVARAASAAGGGTTPPWLQRAIPVVAPLAFGSERYEQYWGYQNVIEDASAWAGTAVLVLALATCFAGRRRPYGGERALQVAAFVSLLVIVQPVGLATVLSHVPLISEAGATKRRLALVLCFALAYLAGCSWQRLVERRQSLFGPGASSVLVALAAVFGYRAGQLPEIGAELAAARSVALAAHLFVAALLIAALLGARAKRGRRVLRWTLPVLVAGELLLVHGGLNPAMPSSHYFPSRPSLELLQRELGDERIVGVGSALLANFGEVYRIADIRSGNPMQPALVAHVTEPVRASFGSRDVIRGNHPVYDLLGVRYVLAPAGTELDLRRVWERGNLWIYRRPKVLGRFFFPEYVHSPRSDSTAYREVWGIRRFALRAVVGGEAPGFEWWPRLAAEPELAADLSRVTRLRVETQTAERRLLASSVYQDGGWRLLIDGERGPTKRTNAAFVGAWIPEGAHRLELLYRPPGFLSGCVIGAVALASAMALWGPGRAAGADWPHRGGEGSAGGGLESALERDRATERKVVAPEATSASEVSVVHASKTSPVSVPPTVCW